MICRTCNKAAYHIRTVYEDSKVYDICNSCSDITVGDAYEPDVYWPGHEYESPNLCDKMGKPFKLTSKREKARIMKEMGVREAGDKHHGAPISPSKTWMEGSQDYRRQQFNREDRPVIRKIYKDWLNARRK